MAHYTEVAKNCIGKKVSFDKKGALLENKTCQPRWVTLMCKKSDGWGGAFVRNLPVMYANAAESISASTTKNMATQRQEHFLAKFFSLKRAFLKVPTPPRWPPPTGPPPSPLRPCKGWLPAIVLLPAVRRVGWTLCCCRLLRTGRNGVSDDVYCKVLLFLRLNFLFKEEIWREKKKVFAYLSEFFRLSLVGLWLDEEEWLPPWPNLYSRRESIVMFFGISTVKTKKLG